MGIIYKKDRLCPHCKSVRVRLAGLPKKCPVCGKVIETLRMEELANKFAREQRMDAMKIYEL